jgi:spore maturation protein SpmA
MLNYVWLALIILAVLLGGFTGRVKPVIDGAVDGAQSAVTLAIGLIGIMALWLGLMRLAEQARLVQALARRLRPLLRWLFPDVPEGHPAMGSMIMNIAANMLGLTNAATPLGLRAMRDLELLNPLPGTATNAMCTFLAINTSSVQLIPMTAVAILAANGANNPAAIIGTALLATLCSTAAGILAVKSLEKLRVFRLSAAPVGKPTGARDTVPGVPGFNDLENSASPAMESAGARKTGDRRAEDQAKDAVGVEPLPIWGWVVLALFVACFGWFFVAMSWPEIAGRSVSLQPGAENALVRAVNTVALLAIPFLVAFFPLYAALRRIAVYEEFVEGAKEGFHVGVRIIPFLVAMLVAIGMFRGAGGVDLLTQALRPALDRVGFPSELLPMALMRPLSGSATLAIFSDLVKTHGADSLLARMGGTLFGSTETTFYVIVIYFGAVAIKRTRHAVPAGLIADAVGIMATVLICRWVFA